MERGALTALRLAQIGLGGRLDAQAGRTDEFAHHNCRPRRIGLAKEEFLVDLIKPGDIFRIDNIDRKMYDVVDVAPASRNKACRF
jgi:hypothetical protein